MGMVLFNACREVEIDTSHKSPMGLGSKIKDNGNDDLALQNDHEIETNRHTISRRSQVSPFPVSNVELSSRDTPTESTDS
jgi:hypothetical protein